MALTKLDNSDFFVDQTKITAKTPVKPDGTQTKFSFELLIDSKWFRLEYDTQGEADTAHGTFT